MKEPKYKAAELVEKYSNAIDQCSMQELRECAKIAVENEYKALRELLFNLRATGVIQNEKTYLFRIQELIDEEQQVRLELDKL